MAVSLDQHMLPFCAAVADGSSRMTQHAAHLPSLALVRHMTDAVHADQWQAAAHVKQHQL